MARKVTIAALQARATANRAENLASTLRQIEHAAEAGAQLICTQELFGSLYFCQSEDHARFAWAEPIPGPTSAALSAAAGRLGVVIVGSIFERRAAGVYHNTAVVIDADGRMLGSYRKMHIPDDPLYYEKFYFTPGDLGFRSFKTQVGAVGVLVCWDQWFPEAARLTALAGAEILCYPTAIGWHPAEKAEWGARQLEAWRTIQRSHAIANGVFLVAPNRVGLEHDPGTPEGAGIAGPNGELLAQGGAQQAEIVTAECDLDQVEQTRQHWPFLRDRRVDAYQDLTRRLRD